MTSSKTGRAMAWLGAAAIVAGATILAFADTAFALTTTPAIVRAIALDGAVGLDWESDDGARGHFVYISDDGSSYERVNQRAFPSSQFLVDGLQNAHSYWFTITAVRSNGDETRPSWAAQPRCQFSSANAAA